MAAYICHEFARARRHTGVRADLGESWRKTLEGARAEGSGGRIILEVTGRRRGVQISASIQQKETRVQESSREGGTSVLPFGDHYC